MTNNLVRRIHEHREGMIPGFTKKYGIKMLVYYEVSEDVNAAIKREKQIKRWTRATKYQAIGRTNPNWEDLYCRII